MESDDIIYKTEYKFNYKILLIIIGLVILSLGVWTAFTFYSNGDLVRVFLFSFPIFLFGIIYLSVPWWFKIHIYDDRVHRIGLINRVILLKDVKSLFITENQIKLKTAPFRTVSITKDLQNKNDIVDFLCQRLKNNPKIKIWGDKDLVKKINIEET